MPIKALAASAAAIALLLGSAGQAHAAGACQTYYTASVPVPSGWAAAYDLFHSAHTPLATIDCTASGTPLSVGVSDPTVYVYQTAYVQASDAGGVWSPVTISAAQPAVGGWLAVPASAPLNLSSAQLNADWNYVAFVTARWNGSRWLIGCADLACAGTPMWSLQAITRQTTLTATVSPVAPSIADNTALSAVIATVGCAWSDGSPCTATFSISDPGSIYKLSGSNIIVDPAGPGVGAAGSSDTFTITATQ